MALFCDNHFVSHIACLINRRMSLLVGTENIKTEYWKHTNQGLGNKRWFICEMNPLILFIGEPALLRRWCRCLFMIQNNYWYRSNFRLVLFWVFPFCLLGSNCSLEAYLHNKPVRLLDWAGSNTKYSVNPTSRHESLKGEATPI